MKRKEKNEENETETLYDLEYGEKTENYSYTYSRNRPGRMQQTGIFCGKSFIAYIFRSQSKSARVQEKEQEQESKREQESKKKNKNKKARERMAKPCPF